MTMITTTLHPKLQTTITQLDSTTLSEERKEKIQPLIDFIQAKVMAKTSVRLHFICTHNSRRSHLSQVWAQTMAAYFNIPNVACYSGGTEATALFPMAAYALTTAGLVIHTIATGDNPIYSITFDTNTHPIIGFSKTYDDPFNPQADFAAILTCSSADRGCPFISGAVQRIPITYKDPKVFDGTSQEEEKYIERSTQIATEMKYVFSMIQR